MKIIHWLILTLPLTYTSRSFAQTSSLRQQIENSIALKKADIGVSISGAGSNDTLAIHGNRPYPLMSVFKFPVALYVLHKVDEGVFNLHQKILVSKSDVMPDTWSPIRKKYPEGNVKLSLAEILAYTVSQSDNIGCDILLRLVGGPEKVQHYINKLVPGGFIIKMTEKAMRDNPGNQSVNTATPLAATRLLTLFYNNKILSSQSNRLLRKMMTATSTGADRIKGQLPAGTIVSHKTGTSDTDREGVTLATNDIGIVSLPNGHHFVISVFVANSREDSDVNEKIIADISRLAWDYFNKTKR